ncbi:MAG: DUF418 domain-containing protein [Anaerolineales bacterium]|nr:DUF418 domain-containing protein [Anaerolineales bacterium]
MTPTAAIQPVTSKERIDVIDITRGFALLGILLVNMETFRRPVYAYMSGLNQPAGLDKLAAWLIAFFAEGKFFSLFSFLFGLGLYLLMERVEGRGGRFVPLYLRRMAVLLGFGLLHGFLLWCGDILLPYAILGVLLLLFRKRSPRGLLTWTVVFLALSILIQGGLLGLTEVGRAFSGPGAMEAMFEESRQQAIAATNQAIQVYTQGSLAEIFNQRIADELFMLPFNFFIAPNIFAMFLLGLYFGKRQIFRDIPQYLPLFRRLLVIGLVVGVTGNLIYVIAGEGASPSNPSLNSLISWAGQAVGAPMLSLAYLSAIVLLTQREAWKRRLSPLGAVGRMALSNYILQTLICTTIFYNYGLGLYNRVGEAVGLLLTFAIFLAQIPLSRWWLKRFRFGPLEWLWRSLTYGSWQPMRLKAESSSE